jgi:hypothetical protein
MGKKIDLAIQLAQKYIETRGVDGAIEDAENVARFGKKIYGGVKNGISGNKTNEIEDEIETDYSYYDDEYVDNAIDDSTWENLCVTIEDYKEEKNYDEALDFLDGYQQILGEYWYQNWKADILISEYRDCLDRPQEQDIRLKNKANQCLKICMKHSDEDTEEATDELKEMFDEAVSYVEEIRERQTLSRLCNPDTLVSDSKIHDIERALQKLESSWEKDGYQGEDGYWFSKMQIYGALLASLIKRPEELNTLTDKQLSNYFAEAKKSAEKNIEFWDETQKEIPEGMYKKLLGQIEDVERLRSSLSDSASQSQTQAPVADNESEQEYLTEVKACLEGDEVISEKERRLLDRLRKSLGISEERAKQLEDSISSLSDEEKDYLEEVKACFEDGEISERERRLLDRIRKSLGISEARAKELENSLK